MNTEKTSTNDEKATRMDEMKKERVFRSERGNLFPHEFLATLAGNACCVVDNWLKENAAPQEVIDLYQSQVILEGFSQTRMERELTESEGSHLFELVPEVTHLIAVLGGTFCNSESVSIARKSVE